MRLIRTLVCAAAAALLAAPAFPAINASALGASYNAGHTTITFNVYSSRATRIELWLYANAIGSPENLKVVMTKGTGNVWTASVTTSALTSAGISGTVYYGYRAWGPNWTYDSGWTKGSGLGFVADVDAAGNRFNPNKLLMDPYALAQDARVNGLSAAMFGPDQCCIKSGALYVFDRQSLERLLRSSKLTVSANRWPLDPDQFVARIAREWIDDAHSVAPVIKRAFGEQSI